MRAHINTTTFNVALLYVRTYYILFYLSVFVYCQCSLAVLNLFLFFAEECIINIPTKTIYYVLLCIVLNKVKTKKLNKIYIYAFHCQMALIIELK